MAQKQKARPKPGKSESAESVTAPCAACGATIRIGDRCGHVIVPVGFDFDGDILGFRRMICARCVDLTKASAEDASIIAEAIRARLDEGVTLQ
jgi:hypothetical protein